MVMAPKRPQTFQIVYRCEACQHEETEPLSLLGYALGRLRDKRPTRACPACGCIMQSHYTMPLPPSSVVKY